MSMSSQPPESGNWKPTSNEIAELLLSLEISPPQSFNENFLPTPTGSDRNSTSREYTDPEDNADRCTGSRGVTPTNENFDRNIVIERLRIVRENGIFIRLRNNFFHDRLVEHFKKKQMMHVYTDESEDDVLLNEYLRKLDDLERSNEELQKSRDDWNDEISRTRRHIRERKRDARDAVDAMISEERTVGTSTWYCGKPLAIKRVQGLITRQLDRIRDIAKFRMRYFASRPVPRCFYPARRPQATLRPGYSVKPLRIIPVVLFSTRLRDELITKQDELRVIAISRPNLTKQDYERLVAEQFYYKRELTCKHWDCEILTKRRNRLIDRVESVRRRIASTKRVIDDCAITIDRLRDEVTIELEKKKFLSKKLTEAKLFVRDFDEVIGQTGTPEFVTAVANIRREHDDWMKTISKTLRDIKIVDRSINSARANLILHGEDLNGIIIGSDIKIPSQSTENK